MSIRLRGLGQLLLSGVVFLIGLWWFMGRHAAGDNSTTQSLVFFGLMIPGGFALAGLVQAISGVPFSELSDRWNALKGWQRGVLGTAIFVGCGVAVFGGLAAYGLYSGS